MLITENKDIQLKIANDFYLFLLNELKKVRKDENLSFLDDLMPKIKELANENNQNLTEKYACVFILASLINLDKINYKIRKKHKNSIIQFLKNLLVNTELFYIAARAMGKFVEGEVDCDAEYKASLDALKNQSKRYQNIVLIKELTFANPSRFFLFINQYFKIIQDTMCDQNLNIRYESAELFRLTLMLSIQREINQSASKTHRISTSLSAETILSPKAQSYEQEKSYFYNTNLDKFKTCFEMSISELERLGNEIQNSNFFDNHHRIHGCLLIILEMARFSNLNFERTIEKYKHAYGLNEQIAEVVSNCGHFNQ